MDQAIKKITKDTEKVVKKEKALLKIDQKNDRKMDKMKRDQKKGKC
jgi:hypothetical protein